jgi:beta-phosphoglucomutase-like phosphatase (HAD superfamily)
MLAMVIIDVRRFGALIFDLDGVITQTASIHARAWKQLFDEFLARRTTKTDGTFVPFDLENDYRRYVDGKPRIAGVASLLAARAITVPTGALGDQADQETAHGLASRKDHYFAEHLTHEGVPSNPFSRRPADAACAPPLPHRVTIARKFCTLQASRRCSMPE